MRRRVESITEMIEGINVVSTSVSSLVSQGLSAVSIHTFVHLERDGSLFGVRFGLAAFPLIAGMPAKGSVCQSCRGEGLIFSEIEFLIFFKCHFFCFLEGEEKLKWFSASKLCPPNVVIMCINRFVQIQLCEKSRD
jgi:hypothetical protein